MTNLTESMISVLYATSNTPKLNGKLLLPLGDLTVFEYELKRITLAVSTPNPIVITTKDKNDDKFEEICNKYGLRCYRTDETDKIKNYIAVAEKYCADKLVILTSSCVLVSPFIIDKVVAYFNEYEEHYDYVSNLLPPSFPDGNDVEVIKVKLLKEIDKYAVQKKHRNRIYKYLKEYRDGYSLGNLIWFWGLDYSNVIRLRLKNSDDYELLKLLYDKLDYGFDVSLSSIISLYEEQPEIFHKGQNETTEELLLNDE